MEDTCPKLPVALIPSYKSSTHERKKGELSLKEKSQRKTKEKQKIRGLQ